MVEDASTLEGNARLKAEAVCAFAGEAAVADDTGLEVDALDGAPGVHSARYAGESADSVANIAKLLAELARVGATSAGAAAGSISHRRTRSLSGWGRGGGRGRGRGHDRRAATR